MSTRKRISNLDCLGKRLAEDARRRGLRAGDRFFSAVEASQFLGVSRATAHRVLAHLARRSQVIRQPKSGTFLGPSFKAGPAAGVRTLHFLLPDDVDLPYIKEFIHGALCEMPEAGLRIAKVPAGDREPFFRQITALASAGDCVGFILGSCPREVYDFLAGTGFAAVILGSPYRQDFPIPSLEVDQQAHARNLVGYLLERGHRRLGLIGWSPGRPGTNLFLDSTTEMLTQAGLPANALVVRFATSDPETVAVEIRELLTGRNRPTGIITNFALAALVEQAARALGIPIGRSLEIVVQAMSEDWGRVIPFPHSRPILSAAETMREAVRTLAQVARGQRPEPLHRVLPVTMSLPDQD